MKSFINGYNRGYKCFVVRDKECNPYNMMSLSFWYLFASFAAGYEPIDSPAIIICSLLYLERGFIDNLIQNSDLSPTQVSATLLQLELRGLVR